MARPAAEIERRRRQLLAAAWTIAIGIGVLIGGLTAPFGIFPK